MFLEVGKRLFQADLHTMILGPVVAPRGNSVGFVDDNNTRGRLLVTRDVFGQVLIENVFVQVLGQQDVGLEVGGILVH